MSVAEQALPFGEIDGPDPKNLLADLSRFNSDIGLRVGTQEMAHLMGVHYEPNTALEQIDTSTIEGLVSLVDNYSWAVGLATFPYRDRPDQELVKGTAGMAIFDAVRSYDPEQEPNFLVHLSRTLAITMVQEYGQPTGPSIPSPLEFDQYVADHYLANLPPLPDKRSPEDIHEGEAVLVIDDGQLVSGIIQKVDMKEEVEPFTINEIPEEELPALQERIDRAFEQLRKENSRITLGDPAADAAEIAEFEAKVNVPEGQLPPRVEWLHALGRAPLWLYAMYPQLTENPDAQPTAWVATADHPDGMEIAIRNSVLITQAAWDLLTSSPLYREAYLDRATAGDDQKRVVLEQAIQDHKQLGNNSHIEAPEFEVREPKRARLTLTEIQKARLEARLHRY